MVSLGAISLAPWLQPGVQILRNDSLNRFQRFLAILLRTKTVRNGFLVNSSLLITGLKSLCENSAIQKDGSSPANSQVRKSGLPPLQLSVLALAMRTLRAYAESMQRQ